MRTHGNTLYVTTQDAYLAKEDEAVVVRVEGQMRMRIPIHTLGGVVCFGQVSCSPAMMHLCAERSVAISFLSEHGRFLARVEGPVSGNVLVRREQYRWADSMDQSAIVAIAVVTAKIANSRTVLLRSLRDRPERAGAVAIGQAAQVLKNRLVELRPGVGLDEIRGVEGECARVYFNVFDHFIASEKEHFFFHGRNRRPPLDRMNALLSFLYVLVEHDVRGALQAVGLDPAVGFLHRDRPGRLGLALDLLEEFRAFMADRLALSLVNLRQVQADGFQVLESGAVTMDDETRRSVLIAYQKRKQEAIVHPFLLERTTVGLLVHLQARLLSRYIRGDLDGYPAFLWK